MKQAKCLHSDMEPAMATLLGWVLEAASREPGTSASRGLALRQMLEDQRFGLVRLPPRKSGRDVTMARIEQRLIERKWTVEELARDLGLAFPTAHGGIFRLRMSGALVRSEKLAEPSKGRRKNSYWIDPEPAKRDCLSANFV